MADLAAYLSGTPGQVWHDDGTGTPRIQPLSLLTCCPLRNAKNLPVLSEAVHIERVIRVCS